MVKNMVTKTRKSTARSTTQKKTQKVRVTLTVDSVLLTTAQAASIKAKLQTKYKGKPGYKVSVINARRR